MQGSQSHKPEQWFTVAECAGIFAVTRTQFEKRYLPMAPETQRDGRKLLVRVRPLIDAFVDERVSRAANATVKAAAKPDNKLGDIKAERERLKLQKERREVIPVEDARECYDRVRAVLKAMGDTLKLSHPEAYEIWLEAIDAADREVELGFPAHEESSD